MRYADVWSVLVFRVRQAIRTNVTPTRAHSLTAKIYRPTVAIIA